jgi:hypothetical protein
MPSARELSHNKAVSKIYPVLSPLIFARHESAFSPFAVFHLKVHDTKIEIWLIDRLFNSRLFLPWSASCCKQMKQGLSAWASCLSIRSGELKRAF